MDLGRLRSWHVLARMLDIESLEGFCAYLDTQSIVLWLFGCGLWRGTVFFYRGGGIAFANWHCV
jgi:hypothetical protein